MFSNMALERFPFSVVASDNPFPSCRSPVSTKSKSTFRSSIG